MKKRAQQEIAGFVIIVVLVVVAAFIFMVLSYGNRDVRNDSVELSGLLSALLDQTTNCVVDEPLPLDVGGLITEAYAGAANCNSIGYTTRDYLNKTIYETMTNVERVETRFAAWQVDVYLDGEEELPVGRFSKGSCGDNEAISAKRKIIGFEVSLTVCLNSDY